jgi:phosphomannomutase
MEINPEIFKAYDIRGVYPEDLNEGIIDRIGRAYAAILQKENPGKKLKVAVGRDMRTSSPQLFDSLTKALIDSGVDVVDIGLASTPTFYFAVSFYGYDGGLQVSASHNPKEYNGVKMTRAKAIPISGETGIMDIRDMVIENKFENIEEKGSMETKEGILAESVQNEIKHWPVDQNSIKPFKIVIDAANAMGSLDVEEIFKGLPCEIVKLNFELDGEFPEHQPDPMQEENMKILQDAVIEHKADLGIAPDGDGDRYFYVDEKGEIIRQEILRGLLAQDALKDHPNSTVAYDIRPGRITLDMIQEAGGKPLVTKVGHSLIKEAMLKEDAVFGGESSGHYFYKFPFGTFEAPAVMVLRLLSVISNINKPVSEIIKPYQKYFNSGEINYDVVEKEAKIKEIAEKYKDANDVSFLDGVTVTYDDYWFTVRASNTESKLRLILEAKSKELMEQKRDEVASLIQE